MFRRVRCVSAAPVLNGELDERIEIGGDQCVDGSGDRALGTDIARLRLHAIERRRVLAHEVFRPGGAGEIDREAALAEAHAPLAVLIGRFQPQCLGRPLFVRSIGQDLIPRVVAVVHLCCLAGKDYDPAILPDLDATNFNSG